MIQLILDKNFTSGWINNDEMEVYIRKGVIREFNNIEYVTLDIANVRVFDKGKGVFTQFLKELESVNPYDAIYIESVLEKRFFDFFLKNGYIKGFYDCCYKVTNEPR